jgi:hypothetical protein
MKEICLGTAMWQWSTNKKTALALLDHYYGEGYRHIDTATNYPINNKKKDYGASLKIIKEWVDSNKISDLKITLKIGSVDNTNSSENDLSPKALDSYIPRLIEEFNLNIYSLMIHWDNRKSLEKITRSLAFLENICVHNNYNVGISGINEIETYISALKKLNINNLDIQAKSSFLFEGESNYKSVISDINNTRIWGYGISGSGLKLDTSEYHDNSYVTLARNKSYHSDMLSNKSISLINDIMENHNIIKNLYHIGIVKSESNHRLYGYIVSPSKLSQLKDTLEFRKKINNPTIKEILGHVF